MFINRIMDRNNCPRFRNHDHHHYHKIGVPSKHKLAASVERKCRIWNFHYFINKHHLEHRGHDEFEHVHHDDCRFDNVVIHVDFDYVHGFHVNEYDHEFKHVVNNAEFSVDIDFNEHHFNWNDHDEH
ncbi:hypothetical protein HDU98_007474 [Podochytrium sp. JEL0797]|nr:hypothetical protein HDU98_007474 [Podochytrium sp. JEL0797]